MYELKVHLHLIFTVECGLIVGVFKLFHLVNGSSDNPNKTLVVHIVLLITITWREVDEFTSKTLFLIIQQKKETIFVFFLYYYLRGFSCLDSSFFNSKMPLHLYV